jgi:superfamily II DNA or RNA helicase
MEMVNAVRDAFLAGKKGVCIEAATGLGKGMVIALVAKMVIAKGKRVLIAVNRDQLCEQLFASCIEQGLMPVMEKGMQRASPLSDLVVASIQTSQGQRLQKWNRDHFALVITDEVHGAASKTFKETLSHFESTYHLGFSATMERHDKAGLWHGFQEVVYTKTYEEAVNEGWLVGFDFKEIPVPITLEDKEANKKIWTQTDEDNVFERDNYLPRLFTEISVELTGHKSLLFFSNCDSSIEATKSFVAKGFNARHIEGQGGPASMTKNDIREVLEWFKEPGERVLSNCELLSTGFDQPDISQVGIMRIIRSEPKIKQMVGRGTRTACMVDGLASADERKAAIAASAKPRLKILDLMLQMGAVKHRFANVTALITADKDEQEYIRQEQRKAGVQMSMDEIEGKLKARRQTDKEKQLNRLAEDAANAARRYESDRKIYTRDIEEFYNPDHKPATIGMRRELEWKIKQNGLHVNIPLLLSGAQYFRYKKRIDDRIHKISKTPTK